MRTGHMLEVTRGGGELRNWHWKEEGKNDIVNQSPCRERGMRGGKRNGD